MSKSNLKALLPVMFGFFIMGFVDIIGVATNHIKADFALSDVMANSLSTALFIWFFILSIPVAMMMNKIGRKSTVLLSFAVQTVAFLVMLVDYSMTTVIIAIVLLGIANTILQVSLNPLVTDVVSGDTLTSTLTLGQFVKAVCSFITPILVAAFSGMAFGWKFIFPVYAVVSLIALVWLWLTKINDTKARDAKTDLSFGGALGLLKDPFILLYFLAILVLVGVDVGMNVTFPAYLQDKFGLDAAAGDRGNSFYFAAKAVGAFLGGILLMKISEKNFYKCSVVLALVGIAALTVVPSKVAAYICVILFGLGYANLFAIVMSLALKHRPENANEVSALLMMGLIGGAIVPPLLGAASQGAGTHVAAIVVLTVIWLYMFCLFGRALKGNKEN